MGRKRNAEKNVDIETTVLLDKLAKMKKLPILTLDSRWHMLFPEHKKTGTIKRLEKQVNELLKRQGKLVQEAKELKKLKRTFMREIVLNMDEATNTAEEQRTKKMESSQKYIKEINEKLTSYDDELETIPKRIMKVNEQLMRESLQICYSEIRQNKQRISEMNDWINEMRDVLKEKLVIKQEMEQENANIYTYMHDMLGPDVIELFDEKQSDL